MIKLEHTQIVGWEPTIRGMRNPKNSWAKSDSESGCELVPGSHELCRECNDAVSMCGTAVCSAGIKPIHVIGPNDHNLMMTLAAGGSVHAKYRRMIVVYVDITAPLYWWKEFDTYKVGTVANSCSTMHKIAAKPFELEDFSYDHLIDYERYAENEVEALVLKDHLNVYCGGVQLLHLTINILNFYRDKYNLISRRLKEDNSLTDAERKHLVAQQKRYWWQMIQLLPTSYNQKRTVMLNYEVLAGIYPMRKNHKLDEWHTFCDWIKELPYSEIIIGQEEVKNEP